MGLSKIGNGLEKGIMSILIVITCVLIVVGSCQVFFRYVVNYSLFWSEELMRYLFVWMVMLATGIGVRKKAHVAVDALNTILKPRAQRRVGVLVSLLGLGFFLLLIWQGVGLSMRYMHQASPAMSLPMGLIYLALPVCGLISAFFYIEQILLQLKNKESGS